MTTNLIRLIKEHENAPLARGDTKAGLPHWDKPGTFLWEGLKQNVGPDWGWAKINLGHLTAGYGLNLEVEWPEAFWDHVLEWHLAEAIKAASKYDWFDALGPKEHIDTIALFEELCTPRQAVIVSMIYEDQQGRMPGGLSEDGFEEMIAAIEHELGSKSVCPSDQPTWFWAAADAILTTEWAKANEAKAQELAQMMRTGEWPAWLREKAA